MEGGERRFAHRLEAKLEEDYLLWYDVPIGPANSHPDFVILHPQRGILILEVKDWKPETIRSANRQSFELLLKTGVKTVINPLEQARQYAHAVSNVLQKDPQLTINSGVKEGHLVFPWGYGVVLANITRSVFESNGLGEVIPSNRVICKDEMLENVEPEEFQQRLWNMFSVKFPAKLSLPQLDRIRWHMFPEVRIAAPASGDMFADDPQSDVELPDILRVMDLQQEQLARSLGEGHRIIHGVAGSGKTLILGYRAMHLAQACAKPILVLCYNKSLAGRLKAVMEDKKLEEKVRVHSFHSWCHNQLRTYNVDLPKNKGDDEVFYRDMVDTLIRAVDQKHIPTGQYDAVLIDEGHDFRPEWLKLVVQMVNPQTNSLMVLYDDAQSIYEHNKKQKLSFKNLGIQAQGRTTILKMNYRNTQEILNVAAAFAKELLTPEEADEDGVPIVQPMSGGRHGTKPTLINLPSLDDETQWIVKQLKEQHRNGTPWREMAILYRSFYPVGQALVNRLKFADIPFSAKSDVKFSVDQDTVKLITMHSSKGLEFPFVVIPDVGYLPDEKCEMADEVRLLYVAMTRATSSLMMTSHRKSQFTEKLQAAISSS
jgi:UvrD-like helicase C-terminal domain/Nuclease-related domain/AAA domain